jgi:hypothetical protein
MKLKVRKEIAWCFGHWYILDDVTITADLTYRPPVSAYLHHCGTNRLVGSATSLVGTFVTRFENDILYEVGTEISDSVSLVDSSWS